MPWDEKIARRLKLTDLQALMAVIETGGIGKAAERLNYSQPAISKAIANLERTLGKRLFERGRKGVEITAYGEAVLRCGVAVFDDLKRSTEELDFISDPTAGQVRIGCTEPVSAGIVSAVIDRIARRFPRIVMHVVLGDPPDLYGRLDTRKVDLVIVRMSGLVSEEERHTEVLYDEPVVVVAGLQNPLARKRRLKLSDVADELWALPPAAGFIHTLVREAFSEAGLGKPRVSVVAQSHYLRLTLASRGPFLTVVPKAMMHSSMGQLPIKTLPIELPGNRRPVGIVTLKSRTLSPVVHLFMDHTRTIAAAITKG